MGIAGNLMAAFIRESKFRPFGGTVYTLGRPTMAFSPALTNEYFEVLQVTPVGGWAKPDQIDTVTLSSTFTQHKPIRDADFFKMLGFSVVKAIDRSDYEGAEILLDLNTEVPSQLVSTCDFLVDGSTLDNVFDPITALRNSVKLLKPEGRLCLSEQGNYSPHENGIPYLVPTPIWLYDFFCINGFRDCQVYVTVYEPGGEATFLLSHEFATRKFFGGIVKPIISEYPIQVSVFAEKDRNSTWDKTPTQHAYRPDSEWLTYEEHVRSFIQRGRPPQLRSRTAKSLTKPPAGWLLCLADGTLCDPHAERVQ